MQIYECLLAGKENAKTGRELAAIFNCDLRKITAEVERERREGRPICATSSGENPGYYLPKDDAELQEYCDRLKNRAVELFRTRAALIRVLSAAAEQGE